MRIMQFILCFILSLAFNASAKNVIDLYGMQSDKSVHILKKYSNQVSELTDLLAIAMKNNAIRVIGETMNRANISNINMVPFLNLLNSPYNTDRNKALYVLLAAAESPSSKKLIIQQGSRNLLAMLKLKQPNNHDISYQLLKKISGKDFGEYNSIAWEKWIMEEQNVVA